MADDRYFEFGTDEEPGTGSDRSPDPEQSETSGLSLLGEEGERVADTLAALAIGDLSLADLGDPRYSREPDGTLAISVDETSFRLLAEDDS